MNADVDTNLTIAVDAIERGDDAVAIRYLLDAWNESRATAIARAIELVDACARGSFSVGSDVPTPDELVAASLLARGDILRRLANVDLENRDVATTWLVALLAISPDPRVTTALVDHSSYIPLIYEDGEQDACDDPRLDFSDPFTAKFREVAEHHREPRTQSIDGPLSIVVPDRLDDKWVRPLLDAEVTLRRRLFDDAADRDACAAFAANPDDDAARLAYASWLENRGNPRGACIREHREVPFGELPLHIGPLRRHAGAAMPAGVVETIRFHDPPAGFPWGALDIGWRPGWAAVRRIVYAPGDLLAAVPLPSLRRLSCGLAELVGAIRAGATFDRLESLQIYRWTSDHQFPTREDAKRVWDLLGSPSLPAVRELRLRVRAKRHPYGAKLVAAMEPLLRDPVKLTTLVVSAEAEQWLWTLSSDWLVALRKARSKLRRFVAEGAAGGYWVFGHETDGVDWNAIHLYWGGEPNNHYIDRVHETVLAGANAITIHARRGVSPAMRAKLAAMKAATITIVEDPDMPIEF